MTFEPFRNDVVAALIHVHAGRAVEHAQRDAAARAPRTVVRNHDEDREPVERRHREFTEILPERAVTGAEKDLAFAAVFLERGRCADCVRHAGAHRAERFVVLKTGRRLYAERRLIPIVAVRAVADKQRIGRHALREFARHAQRMHFAFFRETEARDLLEPRRNRSFGPTGIARRYLFRGKPVGNGFKCETRVAGDGRIDHAIAPDLSGIICNLDELRIGLEERRRSEADRALHPHAGENDDVGFTRGDAADRPRKHRLEIFGNQSAARALQQHGQTEVTAESPHGRTGVRPVRAAPGNDQRTFRAGQQRNGTRRVFRSRTGRVRADHGPE